MRRILQDGAGVGQVIAVDHQRLCFGVAHDLREALGWMPRIQGNIGAACHRRADNAHEIDQLAAAKDGTARPAVVKTCRRKALRDARCV